MLNKIKKTILIFMLFSSCACFAQEEITLEKEDILKADGDFTQAIVGQTKEEFERNVEAEKDTFLSNLKKAPADIMALKVEKTDTFVPLLKNQMTMTFERGPLESFTTWAAYVSNFDVNMPEGGGARGKYNNAVINIAFEGKFKGGKEGFRVLVDPTPTHANRGFFNQFFQDVYIESNRFKHHNILIGNSRTGVGIEGALSPYVLPFSARSQISRNLGNVRKFGLRVRGKYSLLDYDLGGYSSDTFFTEFFPGVEFDGWANVKPFGKTDGRYGQLKIGGGIVGGKRNGTDYFQSGAAVDYRYKKFWARGEWADANGSNGGGGLTAKKQDGLYGTIGYNFTPKVEGLLRYDQFRPNKTIKDNFQREYTAGINYYIKGQSLRFLFNYVYCQNDLKKDSHKLIVGGQIIL